MVKFIVSVVLNLALVAALVAALIGKGVNINPKYQTDNHHHVHQEQMQGQLNIYGMMVSGQRLVWTKYRCKTSDAVTDLLQMSHPSSSYFAKVVTMEVNEKIIFYVYIPSILKKN